MNETIEIKCGKCGNPMRVHQPTVTMAHDWRVSQVGLIPSWSLDERKCRECGSMNAPMIMNIATDWVAFEPPQEDKRVQPASMDDMKNLARLQ